MTPRPKIILTYWIQFRQAVKETAFRMTEAEKGRVTLLQSVSLVGSPERTAAEVDSSDVDNSQQHRPTKEDAAVPVSE